MPLRNRNLVDGPAVFYLTTTRHNHLPFPKLPQSYRVIKEILFRTAGDKSVFIIGYVLMPTHVHLICGSNSGSKGISTFMHSTKGRIRETLQGKGKFWQDRYDDLVLLTEKQFRIKLDYIHYNPVRAGLVDRPEEWIYSSYCNWRDGISDGEISLSFDWLETVGSGDPTARGGAT